MPTPASESAPGPLTVLLSWSSGKDSAWALHLLGQQPVVQVVALVTSFNRTADRVAMHAVRRDLVEAQAQRLDLPLWSVELPAPCSNADYEHAMAAVWWRAAKAGIGAVAFGDLFLEDIRAYRVRQLEPTGLRPLFPLWGLDTSVLARDMIQAGLRATLTCIDLQRLDRRFAGRDFDAGLLAEFPAGVDSCGENGEFHTFVYDAPVFSSAIDIEPGVAIERDGFVFADVMPRAVLRG